MLAAKELYENTAQRFSLMLTHSESMTLPSSVRAILKAISLHSFQHQVPAVCQTLVNELTGMNWCV
jgi:hypothetical protein